MNQILAYIRSRVIELFRKLNVRTGESPRHDVARRAVRTLRIERRREARSPRVSACTYGLMRVIDRNRATLEEGSGTAVNESPTGLQLLLAIAPSKGQILEIQTSHSTFRRATYLAEVCWTKPLREEPHGALYVVGCRVQFGTTHSEAI